MRMYRLGEGVNADGLPFLFEGHAYLADGTPLTECDQYGRVVPALDTLFFAKATCAGGALNLLERLRAIVALAQALEHGDTVRAPLLLLQLQIDPDPALAKFNPWHNPLGPDGGQFTSGPPAGGSTAHDSGFQQVASRINVDVNSTYVNGIYGKEMDVANKKALLMVWMATTAVGDLGFRPGMPS